MLKYAELSRKRFNQGLMLKYLQNFAVKYYDKLVSTSEFLHTACTRHIMTTVQNTVPITAVRNSF